MDSEGDVAISASSLLCSFVPDEGHVTGSGKEEPCVYKEVFYFSQRQVGSWQRAINAGVFLQWGKELSQTRVWNCARM